jgi:hypothetical protein
MQLRDRRLIASLAFLALGLAGSTARAADSTDAALDKVLKDLTATPDKDPGAAWRAVPPKIKKELGDAATDLLAKMDPELWDKTFEVAGKAVKLLKNKRDIIIDKLAASNGIPPGLDKKSFTEVYDAEVSALEVILSSDIAKLATAKKLDVDKYVIDLNKKLSKDIVVLNKFMKGLQGGGLGGAGAGFAVESTKMIGAKVDSVKVEDDEATVKFKPAEGEVFEVIFAKYDGHWYPKQLGDTMDRTLPLAKDALSKVSADDIKTFKPQVMAVLRQLDAGVDKLNNTKSAEEFEKAAMEVFRSIAGGLQPQ